MDADIIRAIDDICDDPALYARAVLGLPHARVVTDDSPTEEGERIRARLVDGQGQCFLVLVRDSDLPETVRDESQINRAAKRLKAIQADVQRVHDDCQRRIAAASELLEDATARLRRAQHDHDQAQQVINAATQESDKAEVIYRLAIDDLSAFRKLE